MFTGIVKRFAPVVTVRRSPAGARIGIDLGDLSGGVGHGDSVCVNGACLTAAGTQGTVCEFDVVAETLSHTTLGGLRPGVRVNIEPSLRVGDPLGGHFVLGHVDGIGAVSARTGDGAAAMMTVTVAPELTVQMVAKGSVAVDGISLTLVEVGADRFTCALIPTTLSETSLGTASVGQPVNVETDVIGKHVARLLGAFGSASDLTLEKLREAGFA